MSKCGNLPPDQKIPLKDVPEPLPEPTHLPSLGDPVFQPDPILTPPMDHEPVPLTDPTGPLPPLRPTTPPLIVPVLPGTLPSPPTIIIPILPSLFPELGPLVAPVF